MDNTALAEFQPRRTPLDERRNGLFARLPAEVILELLGYTHPYRTREFTAAIPIVNNVYEENKPACFWSMEVKQFQQLTWLFGTSHERYVLFEVSDCNAH